MTLVITAQNVKDVTRISKNVEDRKLTAWIEGVQVELKTELGKTGYDLLIAAIAGDTLSGALLTLRDDYIKPWMAWRVLERASVTLYAEPDRNGTFTRSGDDYATVDPRVLGMRKNDARDMAATYHDVMHEYLQDNAATFTWYEAKKANKKAYVGGVITRIPKYRYHYGLDGTRYPSIDTEDCDGC